MKSLRNTFFLLTTFSIAMGYLESAVVVYLRTIYYPTGFHFPLVALDTPTGITEMIREASTIIMLMMIAFIAAKTKTQRFAYFIFCFAVWDIFYYVFLRVLTGWPASFFDYDVLFLIPVPWTSPVLAPCLVSLTMIVFSLLLVFREHKIHSDRKEWILIFAGSLIIVFSFCDDFIQYAISHKITFDNHSVISSMGNFVPQHFHWWIFILGEAILLFAFGRMLRSLRGRSE